MSLLIPSDENVTADRRADSCDFLFAPPDLSGRSPVLRPSQKENVPPRSTARALKVGAAPPARPVTGPAFWDFGAQGEQPGVVGLRRRAERRSLPRR